MHPAHLLAGLLLAVCLALQARTQGAPTRASPRGWQAARDAEEAARLGSPSRPQAADARQQDARPQLVERSLAGLVAERPDGAAEAEPTSQQRQRASLLLPALGLSLASGLLGWCARGAAERRRQGSLRALAASLSDRQAGQTKQLDEGSEPVREEAAAPAGAEGAAAETEGAPAAAAAEGSAASSQTAPAPGATRAAAEIQPADSAGSAAPEPAGGAAPEQPAAEAGAAGAPAGPPRPAAAEAAEQPAAVSEPSTPRQGGGCSAVAAPLAEGASPGWLRTPDIAAIDDVSAIALALARQLRLDVDSLAPGERMQLLQMALQCCQHRDNAWLHSQANELRASQAAAAHGTLQHKRQRAAAADADARLARLRAGLQDGLLAGLALMLALLLLCGVRCGLLSVRLRRCQPLARLPALSLWRPWAALEAARLLGCWAAAASDALLAGALMLGGAWLGGRGGLLRGPTHAAPLLKLLLGLGCVCGAAGCLAVSKLGGDPLAWLALWEAWLAAHLLAAWQLPALQRALLGGRWGGAKAALCHASLSLVLPAAAGVLPFRGCGALLWGRARGLLAG